MAEKQHGTTSSPLVAQEDATGACTACRVLVLGIGNSLLADDGVGIQAVSKLRAEALPDGVELVDGGTLNFTLLQYLEEAPALIVIDAAEMGAAPGSVRVYEGAEMDRIVGAGRRNSVHEAGLADVLGMAGLRDRLPSRRALISVQPQRIGWGTELTAPVGAALDDVCSRAREFAHRWSA